MRTETNFVQHEKFALIQKISRMLSEAPPPVRRAWQEGWTDIEFIPGQLLDIGSEGNGHRRASFESVEPGAWWGNHPTLTEFKSGIIIRYSEWKRICSEDGRNPYYELLPGGFYIGGRCVFRIG